MNETTKATLTNWETWKRGLFMLVFTMISGVVKLIVTLVAVFQFITLLFKGQVNKAALPFGQNLSTYLYQITLFVTFKTDEMPFPFSDFPDGPPKLKLDENNKTTTTTTRNDEEPVTSVDDGIKNEAEARKDTKDMKDTKNASSDR